ncbi:SH3 domain-containing protein [Agathobaculum sp. LCP25S3_E8]|uniref:SH3 domain-containing protein n=1 Tax=Agathobaculum sp. LCP25S3_E8 TaxID=3438735 RepID=UPI003F8E363A
MRYHTYPLPSPQLTGKHPHGTTATAESHSGVVSIYAKPSSHAAIVGSVPCGAQLVVLGRQADWHAVRYGPCQGFVSGDTIVLNY